MSVLDRLDAEQRLAIGTGSALGITGFALWMGLEPSGAWGIVGIGMLFVGGLVAGTGSVGFAGGIRNGVGAMGAILVGEVVVLTGIIAARPGTSGLEAVAVGVFGTVFLFVVVGTLVFGPFIVLSGLGGWAREKVAGPVEDDQPETAGREVPGEAADGEDGTEWRRAEDDRS